MASASASRYHSFRHRAPCRLLISMSFNVNELGARVEWNKREGDGHATHLGPLKLCPVPVQCIQRYVACPKGLCLTTPFTVQEAQLLVV